MPNEQLDSILSIPADELPRRSKVGLEILPDLEGLYDHLARSIAAEIAGCSAAGQPARLILPVGPVDHYPRLVEICNRQGISWRHVHAFHMDDYLDWQGRPLPLDHPLSFEGFMRRTVYDCLDPALRVPEDQIYFPDPRRLDHISRRIAEVGGVDACYGGIGYHGHLAFNEPPISRWYKLTPDEFRASVTRIVALAPETVVMNSIRSTGGNPAALPPLAVTLGLADILAARRLRLYCHGGAWQRTVLRIALLGDEDVDYPVTLAQGHPDYTIVTTRDTAQPPMPEIAA
jgi:glucosamine-6-phosphate deaminase